MRTLMGYTKVMVLIFICYILIIKWVRSNEATRLTKEEDLELEKQLWILNKSSIKTIKSKYGDVYNCIDFYKQPAFDHPLLKNHSFHPQMTPTYDQRNWEDSSDNEPLVKIFEDDGCPMGSVPIRRMTKLDLIREKRYYYRFGSFGEDQYTDIAVVHTLQGRGHNYCGASTWVLITSPPSNIAQYSATRLRAQNGPDAIQIGWRVDPALYGDHQPRLYTYFKAGDRNCFNLKCSGFVFVDRHYPLEYVFHSHYTIGDTRPTEVRLGLARDQTNGNWWIEIGPGRHRLGFWPASIFTGLKNMATYVDWGGEVYNSDKNDLVDMGLGYIPKGVDTVKNVYARDIKVTVPTNEDPSGFFTYSPQSVVYASDSSKYQAIDLQYKNDYFRHVAVFGGPKQ